jgi:hypothetical protein
LNTQYGLLAQAPGLTTDHEITLNAPAIEKGKTYYFVAISATGGGLSTTSDAQLFATPGFSVKLTIKDANGKPLQNAEVTINNQTKKTDSQGAVAYDAIPSGSQQVTIKSGDKVTRRTIEVGLRDPDTQAYANQEFVLAAERGTSQAWLLPILGLAVLLIVVYVIFRSHPRGPRGGEWASDGPRPTVGPRRQTTVSPVRAAPAWAPPAAPVSKSAPESISPATPVRATASPKSPAPSAEHQRMVPTKPGTIYHPTIDTAKELQNVQR